MQSSILNSAEQSKNTRKLLNLHFATETNCSETADGPNSIEWRRERQNNADKIKVLIN